MQAHGKTPIDDEATIVRHAIDRLLTSTPPGSVSAEAFFAAQFDAGLAFVDLPVGHGGLDVAGRHQRGADEVLRAAGAKSAAMRNPLGVGMGLPTLRTHGTADQLERYLRRCFTCADIWCQLFSEPGSGSDLAGLATRAVRDGDEWVVNGQKVWTSLGHLANVGMLLARTNPDAPKHQGLTFFLVDMHAPGVDVRPLRQMTGETEFNEVFLADVRIPDRDRVGDPGDGWRVGTTTLMNERVVLSGAGSGASNVGGSRVDRILALARREGRADDPVLRQELVRRHIDGQLIRLTNLRSRGARSAGQPGSEASITKLYQGRYNRQLQQAATSVLGARAMAWEDGDEVAAGVVQGLLRAQANTIEGGTSEILRNVLGERVLGLPREPGPARETPWAELPRNG